MAGVRLGLASRKGRVGIAWGRRLVWFGNGRDVLGSRIEAEADWVVGMDWMGQREGRVE